MCRYSADSVRLHPSHAYLRLGVSSARRRLSQLLPSRQQRWHSPDHRSKLPRRSPRRATLSSPWLSRRTSACSATRCQSASGSIGAPPAPTASPSASASCSLANQARSARGSAHPGTAVRGHPHQERAAVRIQAAVRGHQCRFAVSVHVWALQRIVATARGWVTRFRTRKLKITKMASDLRRGGLAPDRPQ